MLGREIATLLQVESQEPKQQGYLWQRRKGPSVIVKVLEKVGIFILSSIFFVLIFLFETPEAWVLQGYRCECAGPLSRSHGR